MINIQLNINDRQQQVCVELDDTPLLFVLRNNLGLTAAKLGCGAEQCGACTVLIDNTARPCCATPARDFENARIETLEGVVAAGDADDVIDALKRHSAAQCGYCTPGIVMALVGLQRQGGVLDEQALKHALAPHLCRCGSHIRILRAAREALRISAGTR
ncbi:MAG: (2Fe-2S)-binding protein [Gammaproteobacteria bacterium]|nr:(2Fe-2S)-binding protein [Gammaproteobacteria bacterium]